MKQLALSNALSIVACALMLWALKPVVSVADITQYFYDELGRLSAVTDGQGNAAVYNYDAVGNLLSITRNTGGVGAPTITAFTPNTGNAGSGLEIEQLVAKFVCGEAVQDGEDASGQLKIRRPSISQQNTA